MSSVSTLRLTRTGMEFRYSESYSVWYFKCFCNVLEFPQGSLHIKESHSSSAEGQKINFLQFKWLGVTPGNEDDFSQADLRLPSNFGESAFPSLRMGMWIP